ncbi:MAG: alpha/beta fold hydrolase, partial [Candidatus Binatia bacterium]
MTDRSRTAPASGVVFVGRNGVRLEGDAFGDPSASPVVLLHGGGQTRHAWGQTARAVGAAGWYAIALDLRGHGASGWDPRGDYSLETFGEDLRAVASALGRPPVAVGASLGGLTALLAEGEAESELLRAVVLVDVAPKTEPDGVDRIVSVMGANPDGFATLEDAADAIARYLPNRERPTNLDGLGKNLRLGADGRYRWHWDPALMTGDGRVNSRRDPDRLERAARRLRIPALLV